MCANMPDSPLKTGKMMLMLEKKRRSKRWSQQSTGRDHILWKSSSEHFESFMPTDLALNGPQKPWHFRLQVRPAQAWVQTWDVCIFLDVNILVFRIFEMEALSYLLTLAHLLWTKPQQRNLARRWSEQVLGKGLWDGPVSTIKFWLSEFHFNDTGAGHHAKKRRKDNQ